MAGLRKQKRALRSGRRGGFVVLQSIVDAIAEVASYRKSPPYILKIPKNRPIGKTFYTVESRLDPVTFYKKKDAIAFKNLLSQSTSGMKADIIRREVTDDGYIPTYGDRNV